MGRLSSAQLESVSGISIRFSYKFCRPLKLLRKATVEVLLAIACSEGKVQGRGSLRTLISRPSVAHRSPIEASIASIVVILWIGPISKPRE